MRSVRQLGRLALVACLATAATFGVSPGAALAQSAAITVDPVGTFDAQSGTATISGTYDCGDARGFAFIEVNLSQRVGRVSTVTGSAFTEIPECTDDTSSGTWTATVPASNGAFRGGQATASARLVVDTTAVAETTEPVRLSGGA
ncbi:DUF6299 family protein [Micromonospora sp. NPDC002717]|uniref:DUF6299 family protein n=1 Tax=Micromonospora sp. NPDC002717 TaxID=3154424 RepID=UPI00333213E4